MAKFEKNKILWEIIILWGAWILISFSLTNGYEYPERFIRRVIPALIGFVVVIFVNNKILLPKYFLQKKHFLYILWAILLLGITVMFLHHEFFPWSDWFHERRIVPTREIERIILNQGPPGIRWMKELTPLIIALLGSTIAGIMRFANKKEKENIETELKFLKSQVNPHFLFNALNNIYSLAVVESPKTPESIMQLSEILRYMVYDSNEEKVLVKNEINYIENFVELQLLKDSRGMDVQVDLDKSASNKMVAPLLFIPFVENAFKHSKIENLDEGFIKINLKSLEKELIFTVTNSIPKNIFKKDEIGGVGLENVKKRLELSHPNKHTLTITQTEDQFEVTLKLSV